MARIINADDLLAEVAKVQALEPDKAVAKIIMLITEMANEAESRTEILKVETAFFDKEEIYPDCTVQVLTNTATGDVSVGWWHNETD